MTKCWQEDPDARPTFVDLSNELKGMENQNKVNPLDDRKKLSTCFFLYKSKFYLAAFSLT